MLMRARALPSEQLVGEEHENAPWITPRGPRRWTAGARATAAERMRAHRPWEKSAATGRGPCHFAHADCAFLALGCAVAGFAVDPEPSPLLRGIPFSFNVDIDK